jgi:hypothetical protein
VRIDADDAGAAVDLTLEPSDGALPPMPGLARVARLAVRGARTDLAGLAAFPAVQVLSISEARRGLGVLASLRELTELTLRDTHDLSALPGWETWPALRRVSLFGARESDAKRLELAAREVGSIELRAQGSLTDAKLAARPRFAGWGVSPGALEAANNAFVEARDALAALRAPDAERARAIVERFVDALNALHATEGNTLLTLEREDVADALASLFTSEPLVGLADQAQSWLVTRRAF